MPLNIPYWEKNHAEDAAAVFDVVQKLAEGPIRAHAVELDRTAEFPRALYRQLGAAGCLAPRLPVDLGGIGLPTYDYCRMIMMVAQESGTIGNAIVSAGIAANYLYAYGDGKFDDVIRGYADGSLVPAMALTEPTSGSDLRSLRTSATPVGGGYRINGEKIWITKGGVCDRVMVLARLPGESSDGLIGLLVDTASEGFSRGKNEDLMGMRGLATASLFFNDVFVPESQVVGVPGGGFRQTVQALSFGRILVASLAIGLARGALRRAVDYTHERKQFGKRIWDFQNTKFRVGEFAARLLAVESLLARACSEYDLGRDPVAEASSAKLLASDIAMEASTFAVQAHGGIGFSRHLDVERFMRDSKITQIYEGTNEIQRSIIARAVVSD
ncbi:hypothetical protein AA309_04410 [Microvirga vignae]|uniref:3-sulfinopropanoyl-CoA desulfinase n=1 Tax=Microvirga vignae TaxID=1225564 RepID=A0A0H1RGI1_9HYPH|nr:acyl-CoA dehydrogenase family protein [Microvirga vignae]KLK94209.1 hypothetical protein AA309_04410 [Microvirga vignae]